MKGSHSDTSLRLLPPSLRRLGRLLAGWTAAPSAMMPGQIPDPSVTAGSLPGLGPLTGLPGSALTTEELKYADIRNIGAMIAPLHFLEVKLGKRPQPVKSELDEEEERRKRRREKNKVAAARCRNKKKERTEFLQRGNKYRPEGKEETEIFFKRAKRSLEITFEVCLKACFGPRRMVVDCLPVGKTSRLQGIRKWLFK
ncbi:jun dimerization protein 2 isoform X2 [Loxodonta africana]|uniref:jun dimerization protein 2 isoform X2 n=1 Tax=Loxodonta africana TaxID=9785 RepID=UPI000C813FC8|nr:jun dimerization protein 2 isoform X1 [Loxodonta africana]